MRITMRAALLVTAGAALLATAGVAAGERTRWRGDEAPPGSAIAATATQRARGLRAPVERTIAPPAPVAPAQGEVVRGTPTLAWRLDGAADGARVELSPTAEFDDATTVRYDAPGERLVIPAVLGPWFWRLRGRSGGATGDEAGPVSSFTVAPVAPDRRAPDDPDWANPYDLLLRGIRPGPTRDMR